jgi:hypothetical protein
MDEFYGALKKTSNFTQDIIRLTFDGFDQAKTLAERCEVSFVDWAKNIGLDEANARVKITEEEEVGNITSDERVVLRSELLKRYLDTIDSIKTSLKTCKVWK